MFTSACGSRSYYHMGNTPFDHLVDKGQFEEKTYGPVKEIKDKYNLYSYDKAGRLLEKSSKYNLYKYQYEGDYPLPVKDIHIRLYSDGEDTPSTTAYKRDRFGNVLSIFGDDGKRNDIYKEYRKEGKYYVREFNSELIGYIKRYFKDGRLVKEISRNSPGISFNHDGKDIKDIRKITIPEQTNIYRYRFHDNGNIFETEQIAHHGEKPHHRMVKRFYSEGFISYSFMSRINDLNMGKVTRWKDYKLDSHGNWISRKLCEVISKDGQEKCREEKREITYY